jgi:hypothetical protein
MPPVPARRPDAEDLGQDGPKTNEEAIVGHD